MIDFYPAQLFQFTIFLFFVAISVAKLPDFNIECERRDAPVTRAPQFFERNAQIGLFVYFGNGGVQGSLAQVRPDW
jgi:hypothetical protein